MKIGDSVRTALLSLAVANIGIGMILIGTVGLGTPASVLRDIVGWFMIAQAVPAALQAIYGVLHRAGEELLLVNVGSMGFAAYQVVATDNAPQTVATAGESLLIIAAGLATAVLWSRLSGRRLGRQYRRARENIRARREENP